MAAHDTRWAGSELLTSPFSVIQRVGGLSWSVLDGSAAAGADTTLRLLCAAPCERRHFLLTFSILTVSWYPGSDTPLRVSGLFH